MTSLAIEAIGMAAASVTTMCWVPQAIRTLRTRDARSMSLVSQLALTTAAALWLAYGLLTQSVPVTVANAATLVLVGAILVIKLRFG